RRVARYPSGLAAALSYRFSRRYRTKVDYSAHDFSTAYVFAPSSIHREPTLQASARVGIGIERLANMNGDFGTSFGLDIWALRLGFTYSTLPLKPARSGGVNELALSAG